MKGIRSIRRWAFDVFGTERAIAFVAMATPDDLRANAEYIRMADEFVEVPGGSNVNNYANVSLILELAKRYKVDAVFAGWGHASENPALPDSLAKEVLLVERICGGHKAKICRYMFRELSLWVRLVARCSLWVIRYIHTLI